METQALTVLPGYNNRIAIQPFVSYETISVAEPSTEKAFILANTLPFTVETIEREHIIPVFAKDNEPLISHVDFIQSVEQVANHVFAGERMLAPAVRLSHAVKGRIPEARHKSAKELLRHEETVYYERCAFVIELPDIRENVNGNLLSLTIGGVKAYNQDNLYNRKGSEEHFKVFIGFENKVCTNQCVWSDGYIGNLKVRSLKELTSGVFDLLARFDAQKQLRAMKRLGGYALTESQFAKLVGRARMYQYLPNQVKKQLPKLLFPDGHLSAVVKDYYQDESFCRTNEGNISLWKLYNLFTGSNKQSYIDSFLERTVNAYDFVEGVSQTLENGDYNWFLH